ncbi:MAG: universal stress protein [Candidatus Scalindua sp.]|nr:universal stress protein [Candidatus Scalindua sp.]
MKIKKILCPVDFSGSSNLAVEYAKELASLLNARLYLLHVVEQLHGNERYLILQITPQEIAEKVKKEAEERLTSIARKIKKLPEIKTEVREGKAFVEIVKTARKDDIDLIIMGSHGRTGLSHALIGSVAERVARKAHCPVLIVKDKDTKFEMP